MEAVQSQEMGGRCRLTRPIRDREGRGRFAEQPQILRKLKNLDRQMYLVRFDDGATTFVFPHEVLFVNPAPSLV
jgi:hypothetical protein